MKPMVSQLGKLALAALLVAAPAACSKKKSPAAAPSSSPSASATSAAPVAYDVNTVLKDFAIDVTPAASPAGEFTFHLSNLGPAVHEFVVFQSDLAPDKLPLEADGNSVSEEGAGVKHIDEVEDVKKGDTPTLKVDLAAGNYVLICNLAGHYKLGMRAAFKVT